MDAMGILSEKAKRNLSLTCLFGVFVFLQFTLLGLANHAGEGYLTTEQRDLVYYALQVFVILGFLLYGLLFRLCVTKRIRGVVIGSAFGVFFICVAVMLAVGCARNRDVVDVRGATYPSAIFRELPDFQLGYATRETRFRSRALGGA